MILSMPFNQCFERDGRHMQFLFKKGSEIENRLEHFENTHGIRKKRSLSDSITSQVKQNADNVRLVAILHYRVVTRLNDERETQAWVAE